MNEQQARAVQRRLLDRGIRIDTRCIVIREKDGADVCFLPLVGGGWVVIVEPHSRPKEQR